MVFALLANSAHAWFGSSEEEDLPEPGVLHNSGARLSASNSASSAAGGYDGSQKKISAMNALLPISNCAECRKVRFELYATNGCYQW